MTGKGSDNSGFEETERFIRAFGEGLKKRHPTIEIIKNKHREIPYKIIHRVFLPTNEDTWDLNFEGIQLPIYDGNPTCGRPNAAVRMLFTHLLAKVINWDGGSEPGDFSGEQGRNETGTKQIPSMRVKSSMEGHKIARKTIEFYLDYKDKIDLSINWIERVYGIDNVSLTSQWRRDLDSKGYGDIVGKKAFESRYPMAKRIIPILRKRFSLDYLTERLI